MTLLVETSNHWTPRTVNKSRLVDIMSWMISCGKEHNSMLARREHLNIKDEGIVMMSGGVEIQQIRDTSVDYYCSFLGFWFLHSARSCLSRHCAFCWLLCLCSR